MNKNRKQEYMTKYIAYTRGRTYSQRSYIHGVPETSLEIYFFSCLAPFRTTRQACGGLEIRGVDLYLFGGARAPPMTS